jgi:ribosomal protein L40E
MENYYAVLKVLTTATPEEIKGAYSRSRAKLMASVLDDPEMESALAALDKAYAVLSDPGERANYDRSLGSSVDAASPTALTLLERPATIMRPETPVPVVQQLCPNCGAPNPVQATTCLQCGQQISRPCPSCGQAVPLNQSVCSRCNTFLPEYDQRRMTQAIIAEQKTQDERRESEAKLQALESGHRVRAIQGVIFWVIVGLACIALTVIPILVYQYIINKP